MVKLFLACLWLVWREAEGLPSRSPYAIEKKGHSTVISPWEMIDRDEVTEKEAILGNVERCGGLCQGKLGCQELL